jgi:hypothetical protein
VFIVPLLTSTFLGAIGARINNNNNNNNNNNKASQPMILCPPELWKSCSQSPQPVKKILKSKVAAINGLKFVCIKTHYYKLKNENWKPSPLQ